MSAVNILIVVIHRTVATYSNNLRLRWTWILIHGINCKLYDMYSLPNFEMK
jgi:hypothetical protein